MREKKLGVVCKLKELYNNFLIDFNIFKKLTDLIFSNKETFVRNKLEDVLKKIKKLKSISKKINVSINNSLINLIESRLGNKDFSEKEYLELIYKIYNENIRDLENWKRKLKEIKEKEKSKKTKEDIETQLILQKSIHLSESINKDLIQVFMELTKDKKYSEEISSNKTEYKEKTRSTKKVLSI